MTLEEAVTRFLESTAIPRRDMALAPVIRHLEAQMRRFFRLQGRSFLSRFATLRGKFPELREALYSWEWGPLFDQASNEARDVFVVAIDAAASEAMMLGIQGVLANLGFKTAFDLKNPRAVSYLKNYGAELVKGIDKTTKEYLRTLITQGVNEGWSYDRMAKAIQERYSEFAVGRPQQHIDSRAHMIAVTEAGNSYSAGDLALGQHLEDQGIPMEKSWLTVGDARVSDLCAGNQAQSWIPLAREFASGHMRPLGHPACRCSLLQQVVRTRGEGD